MKIIECDIEVQDIIPPIGGTLRYEAIIKFLHVETSEGDKQINPDLGVTYGKTEDDARTMIQEKLNDWLGKQKQ